MSGLLTVAGAGMVTGVGLSAPASCAAMRCRINHFEETGFLDRAGEWIIGSQVRLEEPWRGVTKLVKMAASAIQECLGELPNPLGTAAQLPVVLCIAEEDRPGRLPGLGGPVLLEIEQEIGMKFHPDSSIVAQGRVGGAVALMRAQKLLAERRHAYVLVGGVDTYLTAPTLAAFEERHRLLTIANSDGFIPGEAAAAVLLRDATAQAGLSVVCRGMGFARESATVESDKPLRSDGMVAAMKAALEAAGIGLEKVDHRMSDASGEQYRFKELALALGRVLRQRKEIFGIWHPADSIGETGAAVLPAMLGELYFAARKRYLPGSTVIAHLSNDDDKRAALVLSVQGST
jgi:3-oxoacyl-[acyl-carrier-protein] synthase I